MNHRVLAYGATGVGKTRWAATWPKPFFVSAKVENGYETVEGMTIHSRELFYEKNFKPRNRYVSTPEECKAALTEAEGLVNKGEVKTIILDSLTFYAEAYVHALTQNGMSGWDVWRELKAHIRDLIVTLHKLDCNVIWLALANELDDSGGILIGGKFTAQAIPAMVSNVLYFSSQKRGKEQQYKIHTKPHGKWVAKVRMAGPDFPSTLPGTTYRDFVQALGLPE